MTNRSALWRGAQLLLPAPLARSVYVYFTRRHGNQWLRTHGVLELALQVAERFEFRVQGGPFEGMVYTRSAILSRHATPQLLGSYEGQLQPFLIEALARAETVIDLGHAEGYYAIGAARLGKSVVAFDADWQERHLCRQMAEANGVSDRIVRGGYCTGRRLQMLTHGRRALVICDIDGSEVSLFSSDVIAGLRACDLLIELHANTAAENTAFVDRFRETHRVEVIDYLETRSGVNRIAFLGLDAQRMAAEYRGFQQWLLGVPR